MPKGEIARINRLLEQNLGKGSTGGTSGGGILGGIKKAISGIGGKGLVAGGVASALVVSSPMLQNTLERILKSVMQLIRPLGDILAIGLRPLIDLIRPVGLFFRILMKPYLKQAQEAMRLGQQFASQGEFGKAAESYALGVGFLLKPFFNIVVSAFTLSLQAIILGIWRLGDIVIKVFDVIVPGSLEDLRNDWGDAMSYLIIKTGEMGAGIIKSTDDAMSDMLKNLKSDWGEINSTTSMGMSLMKSTVSGGMAEMVMAISEAIARIPKVESRQNYGQSTAPGPSFNPSSSQTVIQEWDPQTQTFIPWNAGIRKLFENIGRIPG